MITPDLKRDFSQLNSLFEKFFYLADHIANYKMPLKLKNSSLAKRRKIDKKQQKEDIEDRKEALEEQKAKQME